MLTWPTARHLGTKNPDQAGGGGVGREVWDMYRTRGFGLPGSVGGASAYLAQHDFVLSGSWIGPRATEGAAASFKATTVAGAE